MAVAVLLSGVTQAGVGHGQALYVSDPSVAFLEYLGKVLPGRGHPTWLCGTNEGNLVEAGKAQKPLIHCNALFSALVYAITFF